MSKILACLDGSAVSAAVCDFAAWAGLALDVPLTLLHVLDQRRFPRPGQATPQLLVNREHLLTELAALDAQRGNLAEDQGRLLLDAAQLRVEEQQARCAGAVLQHGDLIGSLESLQEDFDLIVLGRQGEDSPPKRLIGRHLESAIRLLHRPLLVAGHLFVKPNGVLLAYDDSGSARKAVTWVANCRLFDGLACHLVTVGRDREERRAALARAADELRAQGRTVTTAITDGDVELGLERYRKQHGLELVVMGAFGHSRLRHFFMGSNTRNMLEAAGSALIVVR
ncbi:universal stress protein [Pseudomonas sp. JUb52]|uniref:universal stress protein n=1 Tax=Pseudomonas sp. JUb52 TaxID=2485127 RepID=UPI00104333BE|nr:universal stress protein [Pseudomonas sp. JUb52]TCQ93911.1 nucleotide-binding universal stress UspA family protein [Pseudomonas sp. JUb52]